MQKGKIIAYVYTSSSQIPIVEADVTITQVNNDGNREIKGVRMTDENGRTAPVELDAPDEYISQSPENGPERIAPFSVCDIRVDHINYETIIIEDVQVFANTTTVQNVEMIPLEENASVQDNVQIFNVTPQNL